MKILVKNIKANPFRRMDNYPIDREKIERLKISIQKTSFWDNIVARPHPKKEGKYQIAYGHHRLIAIMELKIKKVNIPIRELEDATMLQMMADENLEWNASPAVINETVYAVKEFLDKELKKYDYSTSNKFIRCLFKNQTAYTETKTKGAGQTTILKFLNGGKKKGNWKQYMIQDALALKEEDIEGVVDKKAVEEFSTPYQAKQFRKAVKDYHIPKTKQKDLAKKIKKEKIAARKTISHYLRTLDKKLQKALK